MIGCNHNPLFETKILFYLQEYGWFLAVALLASAPVLPNLRGLCSKNKAVGILWEVAACIGLVITFLFSVANLVIGSHNPFIYFNF